MEFRKIDDRKFQCLLDEEDLEDNNISLDDFFKNDTEKIHNLLDVVMEEAEKSIGVTLSGEIMSLQLAPQPDRSILLTVSSGKDDLSNMLRKAGESISKAFSKPEKSNVIKNGDDRVKYGSHKGDNEYYISQFDEQVLKPLTVEGVLEDLANLSGGELDKVILLCYEKPDDFCHRHLVADWINKHKGSNFIVEYSKDVK